MIDRKIALCHEWLTTFGGSDLTAARIAKVLDVDAVFTFTSEPSLVDELFDDIPVKLAARWGAWSPVRKHWQWFLIGMPSAWRRLDLTAYDVVVTSSHACTNAIRTRADSLHVSYCYTPMRYAWDWRQEIGRFPAPVRPVWPIVALALRRADYRWAQRVDHFIAISKAVARRIFRNYGREATVVYPPVDTDFFTPGDGDSDDFYLAAGRLVGYKRFDVVVEAFRNLDRRLVVAGSGPELSRLRSMAGPNVSFEIQPTSAALRDLYRRARALVFPGIEDFGIVPVEAQACATPVIAQDAGGAVETVRDGVTGLLYTGESPAALIEAVTAFEGLHLQPDAIRVNSERFAAEVFDTAFLRTVMEITKASSGHPA